MPNKWIQSPLKIKTAISMKKKIRFIWAKIKLLIHDKIKCVGALLWIIIYINFEQMVLNAKDVIKNQNPFSMNLGG